MVSYPILCILMLVEAEFQMRYQEVCIIPCNNDWLKNYGKCMFNFMLTS